MLNFPLNPTNGLTYSIDDHVWSWNGYAWEKVVQAGGTGATGPQGPQGNTGATGAVDLSGLTTNQVLFYDGTGVSGSDDFLWDATSDTNHPHAEVDIQGKLLKAIKADEALAAFDPVYITGNVGASDRVTVAKSDASDSAKMPAAGIVTRAFSTNDEGYMVVTGLVRDADTSGFAANDTVYVGVGSGITAARPSGATDLIQNLGRVGRVHASTGTLLVLGAGRANDVPNLVHARAGISADGGATFGGDINLLDNQLERPKFKDYAETVNVIGTVTSDTAVDVSDGNVQTVTVGGDCKFSFTNFPASGIAGTCTLIITNGGAHATTWNAHGSQLVRWPGDVAPALTASGIDILSFITINGGNRIDGFVGGINFL